MKLICLLRTAACVAALFACTTFSQAEAARKDLGGSAKDEGKSPPADKKLKDTTIADKKDPHADSKGDSSTNKETKGDLKSDHGKSAPKSDPDTPTPGK